MSTFQNNEKSINLKRNPSIVSTSGIVKGIIVFSFVIIVLIGAFFYSYFSAKADVGAVSNDIFHGAGLEWQYDQKNKVAGFARFNNPSSYDLDMNIEINIFRDSTPIGTLKGSLFLKARSSTEYGYTLDLRPPVITGDPGDYKNITATATLNVYTKIWGLFQVLIYTQKIYNIKGIILV